MPSAERFSRLCLPTQSPFQRLAGRADWRSSARLYQPAEPPRPRTSPRLRASAHDLRLGLSPESASIGASHSPEDALSAECVGPEDSFPDSRRKFSGPLLRNRRNVREVKVARDVQVPSVIPNSYAVGPIVTAIDNDGKKVDFRLAKANRYHLESLIFAVEQAGCRMLHSGRDGERIPCAVLLVEVTVKK